jgi:mono/diheme cytochrome c family protein
MLAWRALVVMLAALPALVAQEDGPAFFEKNIRPMFVKQCLACHSAASQPIMGGLRLDTREAALKGGGRGPSIVPGNPAESLLLKAVLHTAGPLQMPPGPKMKDADAALLAQWIQMGAPWGSTAVTAAKQEKYWAFTTPSKPAPPAASGNPIDGFILQGLISKGLTPSRPADKRTLIRRATYDLTGLPPTPSEIQAFLNDASPDAYAKVVERLLASPRYGERWGRHWLDVARYADSNGLDENLVYKNAFRYRDYVIAAFNKDKPYDRFVQEQIAGDLLPDGDEYERWTATGFLSLGAKMLAEDDPRKMEMDIVDEQLDTTARAFLGMTVGCARCHDHKFDPITHADYYAMAGIFKSSKTMENFKVVAKWHEYVLAPKEDRDKLAAHEAKIEAKRKQIADLTKIENDKLVADATSRIGAYLLASAQLQRDSQVQVAPVETGGVSIAAGGFAKSNVSTPLEKKKANTPKDSKGPYFAEYTIDVPAAGDYQVDAFEQEKGAGTPDLWVNGAWMRRGDPPVENREASPEAGGWTYLAIVPLRKGANVVRFEHPSRFPYFEKLLVSKNTLAVTPLTSVQIAAKFNVNPNILDQLVDYLTRSNGSVASPLYAWEILGTQARREDWVSPVAKLFTNDVATPEALAARYQELFLRSPGEDEGLKALQAFLKEKFGPFRAPEGARRFYAAAVREQLQGFDQEVKDLEKATPEYPRAMGVREGEKMSDLAIHLRGSHWTLGQIVPRRFLSAVTPEDQQPALDDKRSGRLELAQWITRKDNPLTSRVMVNRLWRWHFGRGLVATVDNFGRLGEKPSNGPLLDYLAVRFVEEGWSIKAMHRLMMLSNTYQMSSEYSAKSFEADPENILLWRMPRRRLEAEAVRDGIMTVSGGLTPSNGGSILKYKDRQYVANTSKGGDIDYDKPVRAVYIPVVRSSLYDVFRAFDLPDPSSSNGDRDATVVAPQALFMMNSSVMLQHSLKLAERLMTNAPDDAARIREAYESALARPPSSKEIDDGLTFVARMEREWKGDRKKAWQSFCKSLLSSNEFLYLN